MDPIMKIACFGGANVDWIARVPGHTFPQQNIYTQFTRSFGGVVHNMAQNLKSMGHHISMMSAVGHDEEGQQLVDGIKRAGIRVEMILRSNKYPSGKIVIVNNDEGRVIFHHADTEIYQSIEPALVRQYLPLLRGHDAWVVDTDLTEETLLAIAQYKPPHIPLFGIVATKEKTLKIKKILDQLDYLFINQYEAPLLTGIHVQVKEKTNIQIKALQNLGVKNVFLTMGSQGGWYHLDGVTQDFEVCRIDGLNPTGAGDAFASGVIDGIMRNLQPNTILSQGIECASKIITSEQCTHIGSI